MIYSQCRLKQAHMDRIVLFQQKNKQKNMKNKNYLNF